MIGVLMLVTITSLDFNCGSRPVADQPACYAALEHRARTKMEMLYHEQAQRLGPAMRAHFAASQTAWSRYARTICARTSAIGHREEASHFDRWKTPADCAASHEDERTDALAESVHRVGGATVVALDSYALAPATGPDGADPGLYTLERRIDWIDNAGLPLRLRASAEMWNRRARSYGKPATYHFMAESDWPSDMSESGSNGRTDVTSSVVLTMLAPGLIAASRSHSEYVHGLAHPDGESQTILLDVARAKIFKAEDMFDVHSDWVADLARRAERQTGRKDFDHTVASPDNWTFTRRALEIDLGEVDGYAGGRKVLSVRWSELAGYLTPHGKIIVASLPSGI